MAVTRAAREGSIAVVELSPDCIQTTYIGYITVDIVNARAPEFGEIVDRAKPKRWIADATAIEGFEGRVAAAAAPWLVRFKANGGRLFILATTSTAARMIGSTLSFAAGLSIKVVETREEALRILRVDRGMGA